MTRAADGNVTEILAEFGGNPQRAEGLAAFLGFEPIPNPEDRLAGAARPEGSSSIYGAGTSRPMA